MRWEKIVEKVIKRKHAPVSLSSPQLRPIRVCRTDSHHGFYCDKEELRGIWEILQGDPEAVLLGTHLVLTKSRYRIAYNHVKFLRSVPKQLDDSLESSYNAL